MTELRLIDGLKSININDLPEEAWTHLNAGSPNDAEARKYHEAVPWLSRGVNLRANAVASMPFAIMRGEEEFDTSADYQNKLEFLPHPPSFLFLVEAAIVLLGRAYALKERNRVKTLGLRYLDPTSIKPNFDTVKGLTGFERRIGSEVIRFEPDDLVYFWPPSPWVELGPSTPVAQAALNASGVLYNVDTFASEFFARGAIKATLIAMKGMPPEAERKRVESWWSRVVAGVKNAWSTNVIRAEGMDIQAVGEGVQELSDSELTKEKREDISTALGIPHTLLFSQAANYATAQEDRLSFYRETIEPECRFIESVLNDQLFMPLGYRWTFRPESLDVYQQDENQRAQAFKLYVDSGINLSVAAEMLGLELPDGVDYDDLDTMREERRQEMMESMQQASPPQQGPGQESEADMRRWRRKALARGADAPFQSEAIPEIVQETIRQRLADASTDEEVKAAFAAPFPEGSRAAIWGSYP